MTADDLKQKIEEAFAGTVTPGDEHIALHECPECQEIRESFRGQCPTTLPDDVIDSHFDSLPLLSPEAFRYFISAYMRYSLEHPDSTVAQFVLYALAPQDYDNFYSERFGLFRAREIKAVIAFLEFLRSCEIEGDDEDQQKYESDIDSGIEIWKRFA
jgi:hypothetical protein